MVRWNLYLLSFLDVNYPRWSLCVWRKDLMLHDVFGWTGLFMVWDRWSFSFSFCSMIHKFWSAPFCGSAECPPGKTQFGGSDTGGNGDDCLEGCKVFCCDSWIYCKHIKWILEWFCRSDSVETFSKGSASSKSSKMISEKGRREQRMNRFERDERVVRREEGYEMGRGWRSRMIRRRRTSRDVR